MAPLGYEVTYEHRRKEPDMNEPLDSTFKAYTALFDQILTPARPGWKDPKKVQLVKELRAIAVDLQLSDDPRGDVIMEAARIIADR